MIRPVADIDRRNPMPLRQLADGVEYPPLGRDVQPGRRLVENDEAGTAHEGHGDRDALLLAAGELVRVAVEQLPRRRQPDLVEHLVDPGERRLPGGQRVGVDDERLRQLGTHAKPGVKAAGRVLRDVADQATPAAAQFLLGHG
jgi:hypothetical protein